MADLHARLRLLRSQLILLRIVNVLIVVAVALLGCEIAAVFFRTGPMWWWTR